MSSKTQTPITAQFLRSLRVESKEEKKTPATPKGLPIDEDFVDASPVHYQQLLPAVDALALPVMRMPMTPTFPGSLKKIVRITVGTNVQMSASGAGRVNSVLANSIIYNLPDFASLAGVYQEFFVHSMTCQWQPVSRYNGPIGYLIASNLSGVPLTVTSLQHAAAPYTTIGSACNNGQLLFANTADPFTYKWKNIEKAKSDVVVSPTAATVPTQSWCLTDSSSAQGYTGSIQFLSDTTITGMPGSALLGSFAVQWSLSFRNRI